MSSTETTRTMQQEKHYFDTRAQGTLDCFCATLALLLEEGPGAHARLLILCIGSDRSTGDALGPLVGSMLAKTVASLHVHIFGTLGSPVHAQNLPHTLGYIQEAFPSSLTLAVDASLGKKEQVQHLEMGRGSLQPGTAVRKKLPAVGDIYIKGVVNAGGAMGFAILQCTRLHVVMQMAEFIAAGTTKTLQRSRWPSSF